MFNLQSSIKKCLPDVLAVLLFAVLAFAYFFPADIEGRILYRHDASAGRGAGQEGIEYLERTGERTRWTNALFSGMPTYQMAPSYGSTNLLSKAADVYHLWLPENVWYVFAYLLGFYILLRAFDFRQHLAALGSILWAFSTYFLIIIAAGHIWKVWALAYLPPLIAGLVLAYRGKYLWGLLLTAVFIVLLAMTGIVHFWRNSSADRIRIRQFYGLFTMITIVAAVALFLLPQYYDFLLRLLIINTAPLIAHFLTLTNTRITNIAFYVICATALILAAINLWIPSLSF